jgi:hypothetical protein
MQRTTRWLAGGTLLLAAAIGCGPSGPATYPLHGQVSFRGEALAKGTLTLIPQSSTARTTVAPIVDGKYSTELTEGVWGLNIQAVRETGPVIPALGEAPREQYLPAKYNRESKLTVAMPAEQGEHNLALDP